MRVDLSLEQVDDGLSCSGTRAGVLARDEFSVDHYVRRPELLADKGSAKLLQLVLVNH